MKFETAIEAVNECKELQPLGIADLGKLVLHAKSSVRTAGAVILEKDHLADPRFFLLCAGSMEIVDGSGNSVGQLIESPYLFGEVGIVNPQKKRTATLRAQTEASYLVWDLKELEKKDAELAKRMTELFEQIAFERISRYY